MRHITPRLAHLSAALLLSALGFGTQAAADSTPAVVQISPSVAQRASAVSGNEPPSVMVAQSMAVTYGMPSDLNAHVFDPDIGDSLRVEVSGLPAGLRAVASRQASGEVEIRVYGILDGSILPGSSFQISWAASDGHSTARALSSLAAKPAEATDSLEERVKEVVARRHDHGMSNVRARRLGRSALPILAQMLRDPSQKVYWPNIVGAIGSIGDTAYFDTLHSFVWNRFRGPIDHRTFLAIHIAQASLAPIATVMPRALDYLSETSTEAAWSSVPWSVSGSSSAVTGVLVRETLVALAYTDSEEASRILAIRADEIAATVPAPLTRNDHVGIYLSVFVEGLRSANAKVRSRGFVPVWEEIERRMRGER